MSTIYVHKILIVTITNKRLNIFYIIFLRCAIVFFVCDAFNDVYVYLLFKAASQ